MACVSINGLILNGSHHFNSKLSVFTITTKINAMKGAWLFFYVWYITSIFLRFFLFCLFLGKEKKVAVVDDLWSICSDSLRCLSILLPADKHNVRFFFVFCFVCFFLGAFHLIIGSVKLHYLNISSLQRCRLVQHCCTNVFHVFQTCI